MSRATALSFLLACLAGPSGAEPLEDACATELGLFCHDEPEGRWLSCLEEHRKDALKRCLDAVASVREKAAQSVARFEERSMGEVDSRLVSVKGPVYVHTAAQAADEFVPAAAGMPLQKGDLIRTGAGGSAELAWDGSSVVDMSADSDLRIDSLKKGDTELFLGLGRLLAKLRKIGGEARFRTPTAIAAVRGTELSVAQGEDDSASVRVYDEGQVAVAPVLDGKKGEEVVLASRQQTTVAKGAPPEPPKAFAPSSGQARELAALRRHSAAVESSWKPMAAEQRLALRGRIEGQHGAPAGSLPGVRPSQMGRAYQPGAAPAQPHDRGAAPQHQQDRQQQQHGPQPQHQQREPAQPQQREPARQQDRRNEPRAPTSPKNMEPVAPRHQDAQPQQQPQHRQDPQGQPQQGQQRHPGGGPRR